MKRLRAIVAALTLSILALGAQAQKPSPGKMGTKVVTPPTKMAGAMTGKGVTGTSTGTIKAAPTGKMFILTTAKGDQTVDFSRAKVRNGSGQFTKADKIAAGAPAEVTGQWKDRTLVASSVTLTAVKSDKATSGGGKMGGKMGGGKMSGGKMAPHK